MKLVPSYIVQLSHGSYGDALYDWSEMSFLYELNKYRANHRSQGTAAKPRSHSRPMKATLDKPESESDPLVPSDTTSGLWWWDSSLPLQLAEISECQQLYRRLLLAHPMYLSPELRCLDSKHAGRVTNRDMVTMLLNLLCNSVLGVGPQYCCH